MAQHPDTLPGLGRGDKGTERSVWPGGYDVGDAATVCLRCGTEYINEAEDGLCDECWFETHVIEDSQ